MNEMTHENVDSLLDRAYVALLYMRVEEIEATEVCLRAVTPSSALAPKLKQLRAAARQASRLWQGCLPPAVRTYRSDGSVTEGRANAELSVSG